MKEEKEAVVLFVGIDSGGGNGSVEEKEETFFLFPFLSLLFFLFQPIIPPNRPLVCSTSHSALLVGPPLGSSLCVEIDI